MKNIMIFILGCCSYLFYKLVVKFTSNIRKDAFLGNLKQHNNNGKVIWHPLSKWLIKDKNNLLVMMMMGPRWNCNATLAISDMFDVNETLHVDIEQANTSAKFWTAVVYNMNFKTIAHLGTNGNTSKVIDTEGKVLLPTGRYFIAIRYYETSKTSAFPTIKIDNNSEILALPCEEERVNYEKYLEVLSGYRSFLFLAMHYHAYAFLKNRSWLNTNWVNKTYLPVGNPETKFTYGTITKGQKIRVSLLEYPKRRTYISIYNKSSLPIHWEELTEQQETPTMDVSGTFAIRQISSDCLSGQLTQLKIELA